MHLYGRVVTYAAVAVLLVCLPDFSPPSLSHRRIFDLPDSESALLVLAANRSSEQPLAPETDASLPRLVDITDSTEIKFDHLSSPEQKYIVESMSGGVAIIDYDRDGWPDI